MQLYKGVINSIGHVDMQAKSEYVTNLSYSYEHTLLDKMSNT